MCLIQAVWPDWAIFKSFFLTIFLTKVAQIFENFFGYFEKLLLSQNCHGYFFAKLPENLELLFFQHLVTLSCPISIQQNYRVVNYNHRPFIIMINIGPNPVKKKYGNSFCYTSDWSIFLAFLTNHYRYNFSSHDRVQYFKMEWTPEKHWLRHIVWFFSYIFQQKDE